MTLEEMLDSRWRAVSSHGSTECPVCQAEMHATAEPGDSGVQLARCGGCGTTLA